MMHRRSFVQITTAAIAGLCGATARADESKPTADEVKALTLKAIKLVADQGLEPARAAFNQEGEFKHGEIYVSVIDSKGTWLVYPPKPEAVGKVILNLQDADGKFLVKDIIKTGDDNSEGGWLDYHWKNPTTNKIQEKETFVKKISGTDYFVYIGIYK